MINAVQQGKEDLKKIPSLRITCWNATRWLGRSACLSALCKSYEHVLEHLSIFAKSKEEVASNKKTAADLYDQLTSYDTFLFIFLYNELAWTMARYCQQLQAKDIGIRDVGYTIRALCWKMESNYNPENSLPVEMIGTGLADDIMEELLGNNLKSKFQRTEQADASDILELEKDLQSVAISAESNEQTTDRRTRGVNVSSAYLGILPRRTREEREREINSGSGNIQQEAEVFTLSLG